ncbi:thermonuclease family protein [Mesorhizobium sp. YM1C-6-2]|uniref:thermonuclease family protein n=1 Tax=Mesorhizobium sp. YM1C-6-2 TaxID=1827501 RepID=UPI0032AFD77F
MLPHGQQHGDGPLPLTRLAALSICFVAGVLPASGEPIVGRASVVDADTIEIHSKRIRFNGIDAPEGRQLCLDEAGKRYRCGQVAALALADFLDAHRPTSCTEVNRDRFKRIIAVCSAGGRDVAEWLVSNGHALNWPRYSKGCYADAQNTARVARGHLGWVVRATLGVEAKPRRGLDRRE